MKKRISRILAVILSILILLPITSVFAYTISTKEFTDIGNYDIDTIDYSKERGNYTKSELLPAEYNYIVDYYCEKEFISGNPSNEGWLTLRDLLPQKTVEGAISAGHEFILNNNGINLWNNTPSGNNGALGVLYKNAITFENQRIDVFVSFDSWTVLDNSKYNTTNHMPPFIAVASNASIGSFRLGQAFDVEYSVNFFKQGTFNASDCTGEKVAVKGLFSTEDIDNAEINCIKKDNNIEKIIVDKNTNLSAKQFNFNGSTYIAFTDKSQQAVPELSSVADFNRYSVIFNGSKLSFLFCIQDEFNPSRWENTGFNYASVIGESSSTTQYIPHDVNESLVKTVTDNDEVNVKSNTLSSYDEELSYNITFVVNKETESRNFYTGGYYIVADTVPNALKINEFTVINDDGKECTSYFDISNDINNLTFVAKDSTLASAEFYGHTYTITIKCFYNGNDDVDIKELVINNTATIKIFDSVNEHTGKSNTVDTSIPYYTVTINFLEGGSRKTLAPSIAKKYLAGANYDFSAYSSKEIDNYTKTTIDGDISGALFEDKIINVYYTLKSASVIIHHIDEEGNPLTESEIIYGKVTYKYKTDAKKFYGYELKGIPVNASGEMTEDQIVVTYVYGLRDTSVIVRYIDDSGNELNDNITIKGKVFDEYNTEEKAFENYKLIAVPTNASGEMKEDVITVTYVYTLCETGVVANYLDEEGNTLADNEYFTGKVFDDYNTSKKDIYGYELKTVPDNASGKMEKDTIIVNYIYTLKNTSVISHYIDETGNTLTDSETINGKVFDKYNTVQKEISGYELIAIPGNASGEMTEDQIVVTYVYRIKSAKVIVKYVDKDGNEISESVTIDGKFFDDYFTNAKDIKGYSLTATPENANGKMTEDTITVIYVYDKDKAIKSPKTGNDTLCLEIASVALFSSLFVIAFSSKKSKRKVHL